MIMKTSPRLSRRHVRDLQRTLHILTGVALLAHAYAGPMLGSGFTVAVQWVVVPLAIGSGVALWRWPRIAARLRRAAERD